MIVRKMRTFTEVADLLGTDYRTVSAVVKVKGILPKPTGLSGRASRTGLDENDVAHLTEAFASVHSCSNSHSAKTENN